MKEKVITIDTGNVNNIWMSMEEYKAMEKWYEELRMKQTAMLWGLWEPLPRKYEDDLKWAYVFIDKKRIMLWVNNKDMKAYRSDGYTVKQPLEEVKYSRFEKWCRLMDL